MADICKRVGKTIFWTERAAQLALVEAVVKFNRGRNQRRERRHYKCEHGEHWHLTSWDTPKGPKR